MIHHKGEPIYEVEAGKRVFLGPIGVRHMGSDEDTASSIVEIYLIEHGSMGRLQALLSIHEISWIELKGFIKDDRFIPIDLNAESSRIMEEFEFARRQTI